MKHSTFKHFENGYCQSLFSSHYYNGHLFFILWKLFGKSCMCRESTSAFIKIEIHSSHFMDVGVTRVFINTDSKIAMRHEEWLKVFGLRYWVNNGDIFKDGEDWEFLGIKTKNSVYDIFGLKCLLRYLFLNIYIWLCWVLVAARGIFTAVHGLSSCDGWAQLLGMWDLSSPTRDWTHISCIARLILNHLVIREVLACYVIFFPAINLRIVSLNDLRL